MEAGPLAWTNSKLLSTQAQGQNIMRTALQAEQLAWQMRRSTEDLLSHGASSDVTEAATSSLQLQLYHAVGAAEVASASADEKVSWVK